MGIMESDLRGLTIEEQDRAAKREEAIQQAIDLSLAYKAQGMHCSESTIRACSEALQIYLPGDVIRSAAGFMGGGGNYGDRCGVLEAGCMIVSCLYGRLSPYQAIWPNNYLIRTLHDRYLSEMKSLYCRDILEMETINGAEDRQTCNHTFAAGARIIMTLIMDADELLRNIPEEERGKDIYE